jgi:hypothetical protein
MQWQQRYCSNARFLLKTDDDVVIHLQRLEYFIEEIIEPIVANSQSKGNIFGSITDTGAAVNREPSSKW